MNISDYLNSLIMQKTELAENLNAKGVEATTDETFNSLVPKVLDISGSTIQNINKKLYSFGVFSDIHLRDTSTGETDSHHSQTDYQRGLSYCEDNGIDMVCITGDILANNHTESVEPVVAETQFVNELSLFKTYSDAFSGEVHACAGNHDAAPLAYNNAPDGLGYVVSSYGDGTKTGEQIWEEFVGNPLNYTFTRGDDVFIFLSMYFWNYVNFTRGSDLDWLVSQLEANTDKRVFLFSHMPLPETFDGPASTYTLLMSWHEDLQMYVGSSGRFKYIAEQYPNVIWFSGHTHYRLEYEKDYENPNTYQSGESMTMVRCPSLAMPRRKNEDGSHTNMSEESEGYIVDVYENHIVINGIDFANDASIPVAQYILT